MTRNGPEVELAADTRRPTPLKWLHWWPVLLGPASMLLPYVAYWCDWGWFLSKRMHENMALVLLGAATAAYLAGALRGRNPAHAILTGLAIAFLCREIHFAGTNKGVYVAVAALGVWAWLWRERLVSATAVGRFRPWLCATACAYITAQLVARRVFRGMYLEHELQNPGWLEETVESMAHILLLVTAFADMFGRRRSTPDRRD